MIRTLQLYIARDLLRGTFLSAVVLTLVLTVFGLIEPLREHGLTGGQTLMLFGYSMPFMLSLTLPMAALFATTITYGRFSQDNELMASKASGISPLSLLTPAIVLGAIVSVLTLALGMYVAPRMLAAAQGPITRNLEHIAFQKLRTQRYVGLPPHIIHADRIDPSSGWVQGMIGLDARQPEDVRVLVASTASLRFPQEEGKISFVFQPVNPAVFRQSGGSVGLAEEQRIRRGEAPKVFDDEPRFYDWDKLWRALADPTTSAQVRQEVAKVRQEIAIQKFYEDVIGTLTTTGEYAKLRQVPEEAGEAGPHSVVIHTRQARLARKEEVMLGMEGPTTRPSGVEMPALSPVVVREYVGGRLLRELSARQVRVQGVAESFRPDPVVTLMLEDVTVQSAGAGVQASHHVDKHELGTYLLPAEAVSAGQHMDLDALQASPQRFGLAANVAPHLEKMRKGMTAKLRRRVAAEIHQRLAYSCSTLLMVMLGAALGLMLRGGQMLAAVAISAIPASVEIVMLFMGKQLMCAPGVTPLAGVLAIWGGVAMLAGGAVYLYAVRMRR